MNIFCRVDDCRYMESGFCKRGDISISEDFELEEVCTYETSFDCPFCGENIDVYDIGIDETKLIMCHNCERAIAVKGKEI